jgi:RNA polymerase sigma-70 factor (ECF subfamily)
MDESAKDHALIARYLHDGDDAALRELFSRHADAVYGFLTRYVGSSQDAEDIAQDAFVRAWLHLKKVDPNRKFRTWLFSIARNAAVDFLRKRKTIPFSNFDAEDGGNAIIDTLEDEADLPDEWLQKKESAEKLRGAIETLPPAYKEVVTLYHDGDLNFREIGEILHEPLDTVKSRYRRALGLLKKQFPKL